MMERNTLHKEIENFDIAIVPLKTRIYGSVPSKIFEYSTLGFPILYSGGGEGEDLVINNGLGWIAKVGDFSSLNNVLTEISILGKIPIQTFKQQVYEIAQSKFNLDLQIESLIKKDLF